ncbi:MAG: glycosyltransferase involved in cell wall biosynthesis [Planctomycetota bacterium]|jgi:glycosyltransferase involved in cell wall biosynthesis
MKLVFVTQVLDAEDAVLGFVMRWVQGLARNCESLRVIALEVGKTDGLPANVDVRVLGRKGRIGRYFRYQGFLKEAFGEDGFDTLLTHMVPRYSTMAARAARRHAVGHYLWYTHKGVDARLRKAVQIVERVFTASEESMRAETNNKTVTGHGIDLDHFACEGRPSEPPRLISVGRLTPSKDPLTLIEALALVRSGGRDVSLDWVGGGLAPGDADFRNEVEARIQSAGLGNAVRLVGDIPYREIPSWYERSTMLVSTSLTGSVDKVVLEAMASRRGVVTCNESFPPIFAPLGDRASSMIFKRGSSKELARCIEHWLDMPVREREETSEDLRRIVAEEHEVERLMARLVQEMST